MRLDVEKVQILRSFLTFNMSGSLQLLLRSVRWQWGDTHTQSVALAERSLTEFMALNGFPPSGYVIYARSANMEGIADPFLLSDLPEGERVHVVAMLDLFERLSLAFRKYYPSIPEAARVLICYSEINIRGSRQIDGDISPEIELSPRRRAPPSNRTRDTAASEERPSRDVVQLAFYPEKIDGLGVPARVAATRGLYSRFAEYESASEDSSGESPLRVTVNRFAPVRNRMEILFGFVLLVSPWQNNYLIDQRLHRVRVTVALPRCEFNRRDHSGTFYIAHLDIPSDDDVFEEYNLEEMIVPVEKIPGSYRATGDCRLEFDVFISFGLKYFLVLNLGSIDFELEKLFFVAKDGVFSCEEIGIELKLRDPGLPLSVTNARLNVQIDMPFGEETAIMVAHPQAECALVYKARRLTRSDFNIIYYHRSEIDAARPARIVNLSARELTIAEFHGDDSARLSGFQGTLEIPIAADRGGETLQFRWGIGDRFNNECTVAFGRPTHPNSQIFAIDIGTTAIAVAYEADGRRRIELADLGYLVREFGTRESRRERDFSTLMPVVSGLTRASPSRGGVFPFSVIHDLDSRLTHLVRTEQHRVPEDPVARLGVTFAPVDMHMPILSREHEKDPAFCFVVCPSMKTQICRDRFMHVDGEQNTEIIYNPSDADAHGDEIVHHLCQAGDFATIPLSALKTETVLAAGLDNLIHGYLPELKYSRGEPPLYVLTYPASIGSVALSRYEKAFDMFVDNRKKARSNAADDRIAGQSREAGDSLLVSEALAAAWELTSHSDSLWEPRAVDDARVRRLILIDIGAGTFDVAAFEFPTREATFPIHQTVSFSLPIAGDLLDEAIAADLETVLRAAWTPRERRDWMDKIEMGKRCMSGIHLAIPDTMNIPEREKETPAVGDYGRDVDEPNPVVQSAAFEDVPEWAAWAPFGLAERREKWMEWAVLKIDPADLTRRPNLRRYLRMMRDVLAKSVMAAANEPHPYEHSQVDLAVALCGRACLFRPLRDAIEEGVRQSFSPGNGGAFRFSLAGDVVAATRPIDEGQAERLKGIVARGATRWARWRIDRKRRTSIPPARRHAASFALLAGAWDEKLSAFSRVSHIYSLFSATDAIDAGDDDMFVVLRPAGLEDANLIQDFVQDSLALGRKLLSRILRPLVVDKTDGKDRAIPLPPDRFAAAAELSVAGRGQKVRFSARYDHDDLVLTLWVGVVGSRKPLEYWLGSTFASS